MAQDPTPEEIEEQLRQSEEEMAEMADMLGSEADLFGMLAREQGREVAAKAQEHLPLVAGGAAAVGLFLALVFRRGGRDDHLDGVPVRELDDDYVGLLSRVISQRLRNDEAMQLHEALARTLREQAPVYYQRSSTDSGSSWGKRLLGLGLLAAAGAGADYATRTLTGLGLADWIKSVAGGATHDVQEKYRAPHGTEASEMPDPFKRPAAEDVFGGAPGAAGTRPTESGLRSQPEDDYSEVHGTAGAEMPEPGAPAEPPAASPSSDDASVVEPPTDRGSEPQAPSDTTASTGKDINRQRASNEGVPATAESVDEGPRDEGDLAEPQGDLPDEAPASKQE